MRLIYLFIIQSVYSFGSLAGNRYFCKFSVPIVKKIQRVDLTFITENLAKLKLNGFINKRGDVYYNLIGDKFLFNTDKNITDIMNKYYLNFNDVSYEKDTDTPTAVIKSSIIPFRRTIRFKRW